VVVHPGFSCVDVALIGQVIECANEVRVTGLRLERQYGLFVASENGGLIYSSSGIPVFSEPASCMEPDDAVIVLRPEAANPRFRDEAQPGLHGANVHRAASNVSSGGQSPVRRNHPDESPERFAGTSNPAEYRVDRRAALRAALLIVEHDMGRAAARRVGERVLAGPDRWLAALLGEPDDSSRAKVMQAARWIDENCGRPITVDDVCLYVSMTAWTLARHFRATVGMSPAAYLQSARFERACRLLAETHLPIDKVARRCGLGGGMALAKLFQRRLALSPSAYRRSLNPEEMPAAMGGDSNP
jgi:transcriptional regulator GlxA family with amidase domain